MLYSCLYLEPRAPIPVTNVSIYSSRISYLVILNARIIQHDREHVPHSPEPRNSHEESSVCVSPATALYRAWLKTYICNSEHVLTGENCVPFGDMVYKERARYCLSGHGLVKTHLLWRAVAPKVHGLRERLREACGTHSCRCNRVSRECSSICCVACVDALMVDGDRCATYEEAAPSQC